VSTERPPSQGGHEEESNVNFPIHTITIPRWYRPVTDIAELMESIRRFGLIQPIAVTPSRKLVAGARRLAACKALGWNEIPCHIVGVRGYKAAQASINEEAVRVGFPPIDRYRQMVRAAEHYERPVPDASVDVAH